MTQTRQNFPAISLKSLLLNGIEVKDVLAGNIKSYWQENEKKLAKKHVCNFYQIIFFTAGSGKQRIDIVEETINTDYLYIVRPGQVHSLELNDDADGYAINFSESQFHDFLSYTVYLKQFSHFRDNSSSNSIYLDAASKDEIVFHCEKIIKELEQKDEHYTYAISLILMELFLNINRKQNSAPNVIKDNKKLTLHNFEKLVEKHYIDKKIPSQYADMLYITPSHLNFICKTFSGKSAGEVIREKILLEAKRLLMNTDVCISEIAGKLNFSDTPYFIKFFKKYTGITPLQYNRKTYYDDSEPDR